jgi:hypothetical protein
MTKLSEAMNCYNPALYVLVAWGYTCWMEYDEIDATSTWMARQGDVQLSASNPLALIGLAAIWKERGRGWSKTSSEPDLYTGALDGSEIRADRTKEA